MAIGASAGERPIRSFVAIEVEEPARAAIAAYLAELRRDLDADVAWTRPENLHLTLKFLGGMVRPQLDALADRLAAIATAQRAFTITFAGVGAFPSAARARVLWVGAAAPELAALAAAVDDVGVAAGVAREERAYHPHVTLGRVRDGGRGRHRRESTSAAGPRTVVGHDGRREFGSAPARELVLFRSDTGPAGARHTPLARAAFRS